MKITKVILHCDGRGTIERRGVTGGDGTTGFEPVEREALESLTVLEPSGARVRAGRQRMTIHTPRAQSPVGIAYGTTAGWQPTYRLMLDTNRLLLVARVHHRGAAWDGITLVLVDESGARYEAAGPVTLEPGETVLIPLACHAVVAQRVAILDARLLSKQLFAAVSVTAPERIPGGPVAVFDHRELLGRGHLGPLTPDQERIVALPVPVEATARREQSERVVSAAPASLDRVHATVARRLERRTVYHLSRPLAMDTIVEHVSEPGWRLATMPQLRAGGDGTLRFQVPAGVDALVVTERREEREQTLIRQLNDATIARWRRLGHLDDRRSERLLALQRTHTRLAALEGRLERRRDTLKEAIRDQRRVRDNLAALGEGANPLRKRYLEALEHGEERILQHRATLVELQQERDAALSQITARIGDAVNGA